MQKKQLQPKNKTKKYKTGRKSASKTAREQEVKRARLILGCAIAAVVLVILLAVFLPRTSDVSKPRGRLTGVNDDVLRYADAVEAECKKQGIPEFSTLLLALIQQESSGQGTDIFQCSESPFNTQYENVPGSITDVNYSIQVGVETFVYCLETADCDSLQDTESVKLALQEYNFGNNYAKWAVENYGGYSLDSTYAFSEMMKAKLGWDTYGDPEYVDHVLRYFQF